MATVSVNTYEEFLSAVAVEGDTVVCPDSAVWDLSQNEQRTASIMVECAQIDGNGTTIKGIRFKNCNGFMQTEASGKVLAIKNMRIESAELESTASLYALISGNVNLTECSISGTIISKSSLCRAITCKNTNIFSRCSFNFSCPNGGYFSQVGKSEYCRLQLFTTGFPTASVFTPFNRLYRCEVILNAPNTKLLDFFASRTAYVDGCVIRGTLADEAKIANCGNIYSATTTAVTACATSLAPKTESNLTVCRQMATDDELRSPEFLSNIKATQAIVFPYGDGETEWHTGDPQINGGYPYIPCMIDLPVLIIRPVAQLPYIHVYDILTKQHEFDNNGIGILTPSVCKVTERENGMWDFQMEHPIDADGRWKNIQLRNIVKIKGQLFTIQNVVVDYSNNSGKVTCSGEHIFYQMADSWIFPADPITAVTGQNFLMHVKAHTSSFTTDGNPLIYDFTGTSDITYPAVVGDGEYPIVKDISEGCTPIDAILGSGGLIDQSDTGTAELYRDNFTFSVNHRMQGAKDHAFDIRVGRDLRGIKRTFDTTAFVSYFGAYDEDGSFWAVSWVLSDFIKRSIPHHIVRSKTFSDANVGKYGWNHLISQGMAFFRRNMKPIIRYEIDLHDVRNNPDYACMASEELKVGNSGTIYDERLGGEINVTISETVYDAVTDRIISVAIGDQLSFSAPAMPSMDIIPAVVGGDVWVRDADGNKILDADGKRLFQEVKRNG